MTLHLPLHILACWVACGLATVVILVATELIMGLLDGNEPTGIRWSNLALDALLAAVTGPLFLVVCVVRTIQDP